MQTRTTRPVHGVLAAAAIMALSSGTAMATVIDFEGGSEGDVLGTIDIATFSNVVRVVPGGTQTAFGTSNDDAGTGNSATVESPPTGTGVVTFSAAVFGLSLDVLDIEGPEMFTALVFDSTVGGILLGTANLNGGDTGTGNLSVVNVSFAGVSGIRRLEFSESDTSPVTLTGYAIDNLTYSVPEPGTLSALGLGLLALGLGRRRRG